MSNPGEDQSHLSEDSESNVEDGWEVVSQDHYDPAESNDLTSTIIFAIAAVEGVDPVELTSPVLYDCVDVSALESGFFGRKRGTGDGELREEGAVQFAFGEYRVSVQSDGWILIYERA